MKKLNHSALETQTKTRSRIRRAARFTFGLAVILALFTFHSCQEDGPMGSNDINSNQPYLDIAKFEQNIEDYVKWGNNEPIGWAFIINKDGHAERWKAYGSARNQADGEKNMLIGKEINMASVSKFYTAVAVMQLLEKNGLTIESFIAPYLPNTWTKGPGVNTLKFKHILRHESGLVSTNTDFSNTLSYDGIKDCIQTGVAKPMTREYLNVNFALCRILIPSLWSKLPNSPQTDLNSDQATQNAYIGYMQEFVFGPCGLNDVDCTPEARANCTLYYNVGDNNSTSGAYYGDWTPMCGGGGYYMSVFEMAAVSAFFENTQDILSNASKDIMKENRIGMDLADPGDELHGKYYSKNGSISNGANQGVLTQIVHFPLNNVECVVVMNTQGVTFRNGVSLRQLIFDAYNDAWVTP